MPENPKDIEKFSQLIEKLAENFPELKTQLLTQELKAKLEKKKTEKVLSFFQTQFQGLKDIITTLMNKIEPAKPIELRWPKQLPFPERMEIRKFPDNFYPLLKMLVAKYPEAISIKNFPKEIIAKVKDYPSFAKLLQAILQAVEDTKASIPSVLDVTVRNFPKPDERTWVEIRDILKELQSRTGHQVYILNKEASAAVPVRLSDGKYFYEALTQNFALILQGLKLADATGNVINPAKEDGNLAFLKQESDPYIILIDDVSIANKTFIGKAPAGSAEAGSVWRISCLDETGTYPKLKFAGGVATFVKIWNSRTTYNYL